MASERIAMILDNKEYQKQYYEKNRERALKKACEKVCCPMCGSKVSYANLVSHKKTKLCNKRSNLKINNDNEKDKLDIIIDMLNELNVTFGKLLNKE